MELLPREPNAVLPSVDAMLPKNARGLPRLVRPISKLLAARLAAFLLARVIPRNYAMASTVFVPLMANSPPALNAVGH